MDLAPPPVVPAPDNNYDFIMSPTRAPKVSGSGDAKDAIKSPFVIKLLFIIGGTIAVMIAAAVLLNVFLGNKTNVEDLVAIAQRGQEIIRISGEGDTAADQTIRNAAMNTHLGLETQKQQWLIFLAKYGRKVNDEELALKKDKKTDNKLKAARQTSTFDSTFTLLMRSQLEDYGNALKSAYKGATNKQERTLLNSHYGQVQLLLKQWPQGGA